MKLPTSIFGLNLGELQGSLLAVISEKLRVLFRPPASSSVPPKTAAREPPLALFARLCGDEVIVFRSLLCLVLVPMEWLHLTEQIHMPRNLLGASLKIRFNEDTRQAILGTFISVVESDALPVSLSTTSAWLCLVGPSWGCAYEYALGG